MTEQPTPAPADLRQRIAEALMRWAEGNNDPKYAPIRRPETVTKNAYARADAVLAVMQPELDRLDVELAALRAVARGYCPACGRGDAAPTVADWERERQRAEAAEGSVDRVRALVEQWQTAMRPGEQHPAAAAVLAALQSPTPVHNAGPSIAQAAADDRRWWGSEKAGE